MPQGDRTYWELVEQLMLSGWYREGQDCTRDPSGRSWHFRQGHTLGSDATKEQWIIAPTEQEAMRLLLTQLREDEATR